MKTNILLATVCMIAACWVFLSRGASAYRVRCIIGDIALVAISLGFAALFLWKNGFIGNSDIQPYPY
jgi:hypothetical protein